MCPTRSPTDPQNVGQAAGSKLKCCHLSNFPGGVSNLVSLPNDDKASVSTCGPSGVFCLQPKPWGSALVSRDGVEITRSRLDPTRNIMLEVLVYSHKPASVLCCCHTDKVMSCREFLYIRFEDRNLTGLGRRWILVPCMTHSWCRKFMVERYSVGVHFGVSRPRLDGRCRCGTIYPVIRKLRHSTCPLTANKREEEKPAKSMPNPNCPPSSRTRAGYLDQGVRSKRWGSVPTKWVQYASTIVSITSRFRGAWGRTVRSICTAFLRAWRKQLGFIDARLGRYGQDLPDLGLGI
ncbi:hypothetical protein RRG08_031266 [Elysia crispata]|uniref:Uncharacterized protein n=1 Tax=Elysia crispata TaxID=231223 RepID=A0AAE1E027_9GAST|nr:hypothetical protein RRG08_031266 [Elysia crispata]